MITRFMALSSTNKLNSYLFAITTVRQRILPVILCIITVSNLFFFFLSIEDASYLYMFIRLFYSFIKIER